MTALKTYAYIALVVILALSLVVPATAIYVACVNGTAATIAINWTFTGPAGTAATITNVGDATNALLDVTIPQGEKGDTGDSGIIPDMDEYLFRNGSRSMTGMFNLGGNQITGLITGSGDDSAVNKSYVDTHIITYNASYVTLSNTSYVLTDNQTYVLVTNASYILSDGSRAMVGTFDMGNNIIANLITGTTDDSAVNKSYVDSRPSSSYNASYVTLDNASYVLTNNGTYVLTNNGSYILGSNTSYILVDGSRPFGADQSMGSYQLTNLITGLTGDTATNKTYVDSVNTSMKNYVDNLPTTSYNATYDSLIRLDYVYTSNASYVLTNNFTYALDSEVSATNTSMKNYVDSVNISMKNYVDSGLPYISSNNGSVVLTSNTSYLLGSNTSIATTTYVGEVNTSMKNYVDAGLPYVSANNGSLVLTSNTSYLLGSNTSIATTTYVGEVNTSMKNYVDSTNTSMKNYVDAGLPYVSSTNGTLVLTSNTSYLLGSNTSIATTTFVENVNTSMKNYVDAGLPYVSSSNGSIVLTSNGSYILGSNTSYLLVDGSRDMSGNLSMGGNNYINSLLDPSQAQDAATKAYVDSHSSNYNASYVEYSNTSYTLDSELSAVNNSMKNYVDNSNTSMKNYVDAGLPYVSANNGSLVLTSNGSYVLTSNTSYLLGSNTSIATTTYVNDVNTSMKNYVDSGLPYVSATNGSLVLTSNTSYLLGSNASIATTTYVGNVNTSMKNYVDLANTSMKNYVDAGLPYVASNNGTLVLTSNTSYLLGSNASIATTTFVENVNTSMKNYVDSGLPYVAANNGSLVLTSNTSYLLGSNTSIATTTYVGEVNTSMKNYVDSGLPYVSSTNGTLVLTSNGSYVLTSNTSYLLGSNASIATTTYVNDVNTSMKNYVDAGLPYVSTNNGTLVLTSNTSYLLGSNASIATTTYVGEVNTSMKNYVDSTNTSMKNYVDAGLPYVSSNNGTLVLTSNTSYLLGSNASIATTTYVGEVNTSMKNYVDSRGDIAPGSTTQVMFNYNNVESANASFTYDNSTGIVTALYFSGDGSGLTNIGSTASTSLTFQVREGNIGNLVKGQAVYVNGGNGGLPTVTAADNTDSAKSRVVGLVADNINKNAAGYVRRGGTLTLVDTRTSNSLLNPNGETWVAGDLLFATTNGGLTKNRPTSGRSVKVAYSLTGSSATDTLLVYPLENPVWVTAASNEGIVLRLGDSSGATNVSIRDYSNNQVAYIDSDGGSSFSNYNESYNALVRSDYVYTGNTSYVLTSNTSYLLGSNTSIATTTYVGEVNTSMKNYVDASNTSMKNYVDSGLPYVSATNGTLVLTSNTSYLLGSNTSIATTTFVENVNTSMKNYVDSANTSMKSYVDSGLPYVSSNNGSLVLISNTSYLLGSNTSIATTEFVNNVNTSMKNYVDSANTSMKSYVDSGLPYVSSANGTLVLTSNTSYLLGSNASIATTTFVGQVNTSMKNYVDAGLPYVSTNNGSLVLTSNTSYLLGSNASIATTTYVEQVNTSMKNYVDASNTSMKSYVDSGLPYISSSNGTIVLTSNTSYILGTNTTYALDSEVAAVNTSMKNYVDSANTSMKSYVDAGLPYVAASNGTLVLTSNTSYLLGSNTSIATTTFVGQVNTSMKNYVDSANTSMKNYVDAGLPYVSATNGSLVLTSNTSYLLGSNASIATTTYVGAVNTSMKNYVDAVNTSMKSYVDGGLPYVAANNGSLVLTSNLTYVLTNNGSYILGSNTSYVLTSNSSYVLGSNTTHVVNPVFGYLTLMAGSSMVTITNPTSMNQWETTTNKNNLISINFTDGGSEVGMWIVDFPADWNSSANVIFTPIWTARAGSPGQTVHFDIAGKLFPDDGALDTALAAIGDSQDTYLASGDMHVAPATTGAVITSVGTGGNTAIIKVTRDSATDNLGGTAELIGLRIKYARILA